MASFSQASSPTPCVPLYPLPYAPHALSISFVSILPPTQYWVRSTDLSAPRYAAFSICTLLITILIEPIMVTTWQLQKRDANCWLCSCKQVKRPDRCEPDDKHRKSGTVAGKNMVSRGFCWTLLGVALVCWTENIQVRDFINMVTKCNFQITFLTHNRITMSVPVAARSKA